MLSAGALDGLTGGLSTQIAGHIFGFDPSCADFGTAGTVGKVFGVGAGIGAAAYGYIGARAAATAYRAVADVEVAAPRVGFIGFEDGPPAIVPDGATGPVPTRSPGIQYVGGSGGHGLDSRVSGVRIMDATERHPARVVYMNEEGQSVHPLTGQTVKPDDPWAHLPR